jgi:hypothetical protein
MADASFGLDIFIPRIQVKFRGQPDLGFSSVGAPVGIDVSPIDPGAVFFYKARITYPQERWHMKKVSIVILVFCLVIVTMSLAWAAADNRRDAGFVTGRITALTQNQVTIQDNGKSLTIPVALLAAPDKDRMSILQNFKVGDKIKGQLQNGKIVGLQHLP